ncbi:MAG TPA: hypothetical protein VJ935_10055 [Acidimicrobiia bacterium]|nr:hypothetical protein [Acidimicrobiia bacterium]
MFTTLFAIKAFEEHRLAEIHSRRIQKPIEELMPAESPKESTSRVNQRSELALFLQKGI